MLCIAPAVTRAQVQQGQQQAQQQDQQAMQLTLRFEGDRTDLNDATRATLDQRIPMFRANPEMRIVIMPEVCATTAGAMKGDDLGTDDDLKTGGDTTAGFPQDTSAEPQPQPGDTGGGIIHSDTGEAKIGEQPDAMNEDDETVGKNRELAQKRAEATRDYLTKHGVESSRIDIAMRKNDKAKTNTGRTDDRNPADQGQQGQNPQGQGQQGQWPHGQGQGQWQQGQADCVQQAELKTGEQQFRLLIASQFQGENFNKQNRNQDTKQQPQDTTQKQGGEQQPY